MQVIARQARASGMDGATVAGALVEQLRAPDLRIAFVFADWQLDPSAMASVTHRGLSPAQVIGGTTIGVIGSAGGNGFAAVGLGLYGDWIRSGIGVARDIPKSALTRSRDAVETAARELGLRLDALDPMRHVGITIVDGKSGHEETFCVGSAAPAAQIRFVGGCAASEVQTPRRPYVFINGEAVSDTGLVVVLESLLPFHPIRSAHLVATEARAVVTVSSGRVIHELDGLPAGERLREIMQELGGSLDHDQPFSYSFARFVDGVPYVRSMTGIEGTRIHLACGVEPGHILRVMRPGDLIGTTRRDLAEAARNVGGSIAALLAFSCIGRHWEAAARGLSGELAETYAAQGAVGFQSYGEQSGMLLVNHTLTGLAIGGEGA